MSLPIVGLYGPLGKSINFASTQRKLKAVADIIDSRSSKVPTYVVTRTPENIPVSWQDAQHLTEQWLGTLCSTKTWTEPKTEDMKSQGSRKRKTGHLPDTSSQPLSKDTDAENDGYSEAKDDSDGPSKPKDVDAASRSKDADAGNDGYSEAEDDSDADGPSKSKDADAENDGYSEAEDDSDGPSKSKDADAENDGYSEAEDDSDGPSKSKDADAASRSKDADAENDRGSKSKDTDGGSKSKDTDGGSKSKDTDGGSKSKDTDGGSKSKDTDGGSKSKDTDGGSKSKDTDGGSKSKDTDGGSKSKDTDGGSKSKDTDGGSKSKDTDGGSKSKDTDGGSKSKDTDGGSKSKDTDGGSKSIKTEEDASNGVGRLTPAKLLAETEMQEAFEKHRRTQQELRQAVEKAKAAGLNTADFEASSTPESPFHFKIPAEWRKENKPGVGKIMYNTDKGYLLVYEKFKSLNRAYIISGSQYPMEKKGFIDNGGQQLSAQIVKTGPRRDTVDIFKIKIEAVAVLWGRDRVHRAFITLRETEDGEVLLYNITSMRARWGAENTTLRLYYEFLMRQQEPPWEPAKKRRVNRHHNSEVEFLRENHAAINGGWKAVQILKTEDNENELHLVEERLELIS